MKKNSGFTLIEIIIAMLLLSIVFMAYINGFGDGFKLLKRGQEYTDETFNAQEQIENQIISTKQDFVDGVISGSHTVTVFSGNSTYKSDVEVNEIVEPVTPARNYITYVSNVPTPQPLAPEVEYTFNVSNYGNTVDYFPWNENGKYFYYEYELSTDGANEPDIFENRIRHYESKNNIENPDFPGDYDKIYDDTIQEPDVNVSKNKSMKIKTGSFKKNRYYFFEVSPYSFAGKITSVKNKFRVAKYDRKGSNFWQELIEEVYFVKYLEKPETLYDSKFFEIITDTEKYGEVFQDPKYPRLDIDWEKNEDSEGAIWGKLIPNSVDYLDFAASVKFQADKNTRESGISNQGFGVMLGPEGESNNNTGTMFTFDVTNNKLMVHEVLNGQYKNLIQEYDLMTDPNFSNLLVDPGTGLEFDWDSKYDLLLNYNNKKISFLLNKESGGSSTPITIDAYDTGYAEHNFIGLKSFSGLPYKYQFESDDDIVNEYFRYYGAHFYDINFY